MKSKKAARPSKALQSVAYHEAGHVVVRWHGRLKMPKYVTIIPDEEFLGHVFGPSFPGSFDFGETQWSGRTQLQLEGGIRSIWGGPLAQKKFNPRGFRHYHAAKDYKQIVDLAFNLSGSDDETASAYIKLLELQTRNLLNQGWIWQCVEAVAGALLEQEKLSGKQVREIILEAVQERVKKAGPPVGRIIKSPLTVPQDEPDE